jgi:hypothetical protein
MFLVKVGRVVDGRDKSFHHVFGGPGKHLGVTPQGCTQPLHLVYTFDTTDPAFPFQIPGIRYLPLYYSFPYNAGACGYQVKSETQIEVLYMETKVVAPKFPYDNYPSEFPKRDVRILQLSYEQYKTLVYFLEADDAPLSEEDHKLIEDDFHYPFTQLGGVHRMWQGIPDVPCPNKSCVNSRTDNEMEVFAVVWNEPHKGVFLWEKDDNGGCDIQTIFQVCPKCYSIHACNRCT